MNKIIFYGAGKIGRRMLALFHDLGVQVNLFLDSSPEKWNSEYCGVNVIKPDNIDDLRDYTFFITSNQEYEIRDKLCSLGVHETNIRKGNTMTSMLFFLTVERKLKLSVLYNAKNSDNPCGGRALIDMQNGLVLGGVESWSLQTMKVMEKIGIPTKLLTSDLNKHTVENERNKIIELRYCAEHSDKRRIEICLQSIIDLKPSTILCNFISYHFYAAVNAKQEYLRNMKLITVLHNDEDVYYEGYVTFKDNIDFCLVISSAMRAKLISRGFPSDKIITLPWKIMQEQKFRRQYSSQNETIRIGYAGRVVVKQKRMDLILKVVQRLKELGINYRLEVAGNGSYEEEMRESIIQQGFEGRISLIGYVERDDIMRFWEQQDIMLSCSEWEGHSISQCEAMAAGAVPVVTDVSGARDDVIDGYNGFVRPVGDTEGLIESIIFLYQNRDKLNEMGRNSFMTIKTKYASFDEEKFWKSIIVDK